MNNTGDAAEQVVRLSLEGTEVALRLSGSAAKNIAAAIYTIMKNRDRNKLRGRQRLTAMLKSGKELKVFTLAESHLKQFTQEAKRYGVVYCALRDKKSAGDGQVDILVRAEDAAKINRIVERFKLAAVDAASIKHEIQRTREEQTAGQPAPEQDRPGRDTSDRLLDDLMGQGAKEAAENPAVAKTEKSPPSAPTSGKQPKAAEGSTKSAEERPSVRQALRDIRAERQKQAEPPQKTEPTKQRRQSAPQNHRPKRKRKAKVR